MSVAGVGFDIVEIARMDRALAKSPAIRQRAFSPEEQDFCNKNKRPELQYAMRFAAKEAVLKALGTGFSGMKFTDVEVGFDAQRKPVVILHGRAQEIAQKRGIVEMHISLSFTHETAVASVIAVTEEAKVPPKEEKLDQRAELAASFKELRTALDEIGVDTVVAEEESLDQEDS